jgi:hypothetical protein
VSVAHCQHANLYALFGDLFRRIHFQAERVTPNCETFFDASGGDSDVINL